MVLFQQIMRAPERVAEFGLGRYVIRILKRVGLRADLRFTLSVVLKSIIEARLTIKSLFYRPYIAQKPVDLKISKKTHCLKIPADNVQGVEDLVSDIRKFYSENETEIEERRGRHKYAFLINTLVGDSSDDLNSEEQELLRKIVKFAAQPTLMGLAAEYIGQIPALHGYSLNHVKKDAGITDLEGSQLYHRDVGCQRLLHLIVHVTDCYEGDGPFTFIDAEWSEHLKQSLGHQAGRVSDEDVDKFVDPNAINRVMGPAGLTTFVNPERCFHYGARNTSGERIQLVISYAPPNEAVEGICCPYLKKYKKYFDAGSLSVAEKHLLKMY